MNIEFPAGWTITSFSNTKTGASPDGEWRCSVNLNKRGEISCLMKDGLTQIHIYQPDESFNTKLAGKRTCYYSNKSSAERICKALGGTKIQNGSTVAEKYSYEF